MAVFLRKVEKPPEGASAFPALVDEDFMRDFPALYEYCSCTVWDDGSPRESSTLFIFADQGRWKLMLKDREMSRVCFVTSDAFYSLLEVADLALAEGRADWRVDRVAPAGRRGGK